MSIYHYKSTKQVLSAVVFDGTINSVKMFIPVDLYEYEKHDRVNDTQFPTNRRMAISRVLPSTNAVSEGLAEPSSRASSLAHST